MFQDFRYSDTTHLSQSVEVLKLKNFKKDATLKLSKSTNQERYEHVGPEVASSQNGKVTRWRRDCAWLMISRCSIITISNKVQEQAQSYRPPIKKNDHYNIIQQEKVKSKRLKLEDEAPIKLAFKATNIILQGLPPEVYALVSNHRIAKELWEIIQLLMQGTSLTKQERECKLYDEFDKFAYKKGETLRLTVPVFKQGDNPIDAINHMMSFLSAVVTSRYPTTNNQLRNSTYTPGASRSNSGKQRLLFVTTAKGKDTCPNSALNLKGNGMIRGLRIKCCWYKLKQMVKFYMRRSLAFLADSRNCRRLGWQYVTDLQHATVQNSNSSAQQDALILSVIEQLKTQIFFYDHTTKQALGFQNPFYLKKAQQLEPKLYDGNVIKNTSAIVIPDSRRDP
ncbi:hypothetical protein Tco_1069960 [Tanacetum coccineum]|uniref:Integrase, catalytic region, zinc finger, CCHC-type, peptidase aspartic, catalytic n=1 Tax=Tanacetum coccineum TaxID=301880 RepID=A0ABQ5HK22_9ASTR